MRGGVRERQNVRLPPPPPFLILNVLVQHTILTDARHLSSCRGPCGWSGARERGGRRAGDQRKKTRPLRTPFARSAPSSAPSFPSPFPPLSLTMLRASVARPAGLAAPARRVAGRKAAAPVAALPKVRTVFLANPTSPPPPLAAPTGRTRPLCGRLGAKGGAQGTGAPRGGPSPRLNRPPLAPRERLAASLAPRHHAPDRPSLGPTWSRLAPPGRGLGRHVRRGGCAARRAPSTKNARPPALPPLPPSSRARPHWRPPPFERAQCGRMCARGPRA